MVDKTEKRDLSIRMVVTFAVSLAVFAVASHFALIALFGRYSATADRRDPPRSPVAEAREEPPSPRLQVNSAVDLATLRRREEQQLQRYGWVDRDRGILQIPIDRAMKLIEEQGLPARAAPRTAD